MPCVVRRRVAAHLFDASFGLNSEIVESNFSLDHRSFTHHYSKSQNSSAHLISAFDFAHGDPEFMVRFQTVFQTAWPNIRFDIGVRTREHMMYWIDQFRNAFIGDGIECSRATILPTGERFYGSIVDVTIRVDLKERTIAFSIQTPYTGGVTDLGVIFENVGAIEQCKPYIALYCDATVTFIDGSDAPFATAAAAAADNSLPARILPSTASAVAVDK
jgi:hypothetical protein